MKFAVFFSAGLGDALLLVPLVKALKTQGEVTGFFDSHFQCEQLFHATQLLPTSIIIDGKYDWLKTSIKQRKEYDVAYLNHFASSRKNILLAQQIANKTITNRIPESLSEALRKRIEYIEPIKGVHEAIQNLRLLNYETPQTLDEEAFYLNFHLPESKEFTFPKPTIAVQISSGNNVDRYKNWPTKNWKLFLAKAAKEYSSFSFVLIGEPKEKQLAEEIMVELPENVHSTVGETSIQDLIFILQNSTFFIGLDGGPMHLAACLGKPTLTLWGASDFNLYGYHVVNPNKHQILFSDLNCRPCNSWIAPNTTRVSNPNDCPDLACMAAITPQQVYQAFNAMRNHFKSPIDNHS